MLECHFKSIIILTLYVKGVWSSIAAGVLHMEAIKTKKLLNFILYCVDVIVALLHCIHHICVTASCAPTSNRQGEVW